MEGEVAQAGVLGAADPVLAPGPAAMAEFEIGELPAAGAGGKAGEPVPADVGEAQLRAGKGTFLAHDDRHALVRRMLYIFQGPPARGRGYCTATRTASSARR